MMEYWNNDLKKDEIPSFNSFQDEFFNNPTQLSIFPKPNTPVFQYSNIPSVTCPLMPRSGR
jgi:hypothetical protein